MNQLGYVVELPEEVAASVAWIVSEKDKRIAELENWIEESAIHNDTCTYNILRRTCSDCRCSRQPPLVNER